METLVACLTPPGKAAIATIGVRGPLAWSITRQLFTPALPADPNPRQHWFGYLGGDTRDQVILAVREIDPTPWIEIHCHGGVEVVRMILHLFQHRGSRLAAWQEFTARDHAEARLLELLARAPTTRTAGILLDQLAGARPADPERYRSLKSLARHLVEPWKVVIAGAPNVGKSSLMNALAGFTRSVVSPVPGTTRDVVTVQLAIDGWPVEMTDTAGLRSASSDLESQGIARARLALADADLRLWILDGASDRIMPEEDADWCMVINKTDLSPAWEWASIADAISVSATTGAGLVTLCEAISNCLVPHQPKPGEAVPWQCDPDAE